MPFLFSSSLPEHKLTMIESSLLVRGKTGSVATTHPLQESLKPILYVPCINNKLYAKETFGSWTGSNPKHLNSSTWVSHVEVYAITHRSCWSSQRDYTAEQGKPLIATQCVVYIPTPVIFFNMHWQPKCFFPVHCDHHPSWIRTLGHLILRLKLVSSENFHNAEPRLTIVIMNRIHIFQLSVKFCQQWAKLRLHLVSTHQ